MLKKYAEQDAERAEEAVERAEFYEKAECVATLVAAGGSAASDGLLLTGIAGVLKGVAQAVAAPLWPAPAAWATAGAQAATVGGRRAALVGGTVAAERIGGAEVGLGDFTSRFAAVQTPRALRRTAAACSR